MLLVFNLRGDDATALLGGTALIILSVGCALKYGVEGLEKATDFIRKGVMFGIKVFVPVLVIGGFFFLGKEDLAQAILDSATEINFQKHKNLVNCKIWKKNIK